MARSEALPHTTQGHHMNSTNAQSYDHQNFRAKWISLFGEAVALIPGGISSAVFRDEVRSCATAHIGWKRRLQAREWVYAAEYYIELLQQLHMPDGVDFVD